jgi:hypothetical protein
MMTQKYREGDCCIDYLARDTFSLPLSVTNFSGPPLGAFLYLWMILVGLASHLCVVISFGFIIINPKNDDK